jgi:hypothetical protein
LADGRHWYVFRVDKQTGGKGMRRLPNSESDPNRGLGKAFRDRIPLSFPWWDLSDLKRGLDRKEFVSEIAGIQERLVAFVPLLDNLDERFVVVEAWHVLEKLKPSGRSKGGRGNR